MKLARYVGDGRVEIVDEAPPALPAGGLIVKTEACGLCSGELMAWYMDRKLPHVLGHEVAGVVVESDDARFPVGVRVFPHHHAPCMKCDRCRSGRYVHCETWRKTKLAPGGMADTFAVAPENLADTHIVDGLRPVDAALAEPLACVVKSLEQGRWVPGTKSAVIGLGAMGLLHMLALGENALGFEMNVERMAHARELGMRAAQSPEEGQEFDIVFVCPGVQAALDLAVSVVAPGGTIVLFAPFHPDVTPLVPLNELYFRDVTLATSYSAGPKDCLAAIDLLREGTVKAEQVVSDFIGLDELPDRYVRMRDGKILKAMVKFS